MTPPSVLVLYPGTDHTLLVPALTNGQTGEPVTDATVEATLLDEDGVPLAGWTWPVELVTAEATPGRYVGNLSASLDITDRQTLALVVVADAGPGLKRTWRLPVVVRYA